MTDLEMTKILNLLLDLDEVEVFVWSCTVRDRLAEDVVEEA